MDVQALRSYLQNQPSVRLAFLFGSRASGRAVEESDADIAVLLDPPAAEDRVWRELTRLLGLEVDLVRLDQAPATLVARILVDGVPLVLRDRRAYLRLLLDATLEAEDFAGFARGYRQVARRSTSLAPEDEARLLERLTFLEQELGDMGDFRALGLGEYLADRTRRRSMERCAENIINAMIDIAKLLLASEHQPMPKTYQEALLRLGLLAGLDQEQAERLGDLARLRNLLAHEYWQVLHERLGQFIAAFPPLYAQIRPFLQAQVRTDPLP